MSELDKRKARPKWPGLLVCATAPGSGEEESDRGKHLIEEDECLGRELEDASERGDTLFGDRQPVGTGDHRVGVTGHGDGGELPAADAEQARTSI